MAITIREDVSLATLSTLRVGGVAKRVFEVSSEEDLQELISIYRNQTTDLPIVVGCGSNILFTRAVDERLFVVNKILGIAIEETEESYFLSCGAGEILDELVAHVAGKSIWGFENLSAIPGTVGAMPVQNVGAYGVDTAKILHEVTAIHLRTGEKKTFSKTDCGLRYRDSFFKTSVGREWCITRVVFELSKKNRPELQYADLQHSFTEPPTNPTQVRELVVSIRKKKFPDWHTNGTAGSFFKNPILDEELFQSLKAKFPELPGYQEEDGIKIPLGYVLDKICGLRGYRKGNVSLYESQALVVVTHDNASADEVVSFVESVQMKVKKKTGIEPSPEVRFV